MGNLTSPRCQSVNVLNLFDRTSRRHHSHGSRKYNKPEIHDVSFDGLLPFVNLQLGLHHIRTRLYSLPLKRLHALYESTLTLHFADVGSPGHRLQGIILDISSNRLFLFFTFITASFSLLLLLFPELGLALLIFTLFLSVSLSADSESWIVNFLFSP